MATKHQVLELHKAHPDWNSAMIADVLDCESAYVRATFKHNGLTFLQGSLIRELGRAAFNAGLSVQDIRRLAKRAA